MDMKTFNIDSMDTGQLQHIIKDEGLPHLYRKYATTKLNAIESRLEGKIAKALLLKGLCDEIYDRMPSNIRW